MLGFACLPFAFLKSPNGAFELRSIITFVQTAIVFNCIVRKVLECLPALLDLLNMSIHLFNEDLWNRVTLENGSILLARLQIAESGAKGAGSLSLVRRVSISGAHIADVSPSNLSIHFVSKFVVAAHVST